MIVSYSALFGIMDIIVFQLTERIAVTEKSMKSVLGHCIDVLAFSYNAIPTRHEVPAKPCLQYENKMNDDNKNAQN